MPLRLAIVCVACEDCIAGPADGVQPAESPRSLREYGGKFRIGWILALHGRVIAVLPGALNRLRATEFVETIKKFEHRSLNGIFFVWGSETWQDEHLFAKSSNFCGVSMVS